MPVLTILEILTLIAAAAYLTYVVNTQDGPLHIFKYLRKTPLTIGEMAACPVCAAFWVSLGLVLLVLVDGWIVIAALALAGVVVLVGRLWDQYATLIRRWQEREALRNSVILRDGYGDVEADDYIEQTVFRTSGGDTVELETAS